MIKRQLQNPHFCFCKATPAFCEPGWPRLSLALGRGDSLGRGRVPCRGGGRGAAGSFQARHAASADSKGHSGGFSGVALHLQLLQPGENNLALIQPDLAKSRLRKTPRRPDMYSNVTVKCVERQIFLAGTGRQRLEQTGGTDTASGALCLGALQVQIWIIGSENY